MGLTLNNNSNFASKPTKNECLSVLSFFSVFLFLGLHAVETLCVLCSTRFLFARCACQVTFKCVPFFWRTHDLFRMKFDGLLKYPLTMNNNSNFASNQQKTNIYPLHLK